MFLTREKSDPDLVYLHKKAYDLQTDATLLKEKLNGGSPPEIDTVLELLRSIDPKKSSREEWDTYQRASRIFIRVADRSHLLSVIAGARARLYRLDTPNKAIWTEDRVDKLLKETEGNEAVSPTTRAQIEALVAAQDECGFRFTRDQEVSNGVFIIALLVAGLVFLISLIVATWTRFPGLPDALSWKIFPIALWGASGGLANAAFGLRSRKIYRHQKTMELTALFYRGVIGIISAVIITFIIKARLVDFPALRAGTNGEMPPEVLYVAAFVIGFWDGLFVRMLPDLGFKKKETKDDQTRGRGK